MEIRSSLIYSNRLHRALKHPGSMIFVASHAPKKAQHIRDTRGFLFFETASGKKVVIVQLTAAKARDPELKGDSMKPQTPLVEFEQDPVQVLLHKSLGIASHNISITQEFRQGLRKGTVLKSTLAGVSRNEPHLHILVEVARSVLHWHRSKEKSLAWAQEFI